MLHKCANPNCSVRFRQLRRGKLFQIELGHLAAATLGQQAARRSRPLRRVERYWLCDECAPKLSLVFDPAHGIVTVPLRAIRMQPIPGVLPWNGSAAAAQTGLGIQPSRVGIRGLS